MPVLGLSLFKKKKKNRSLQTPECMCALRSACLLNFVSYDSLVSCTEQLYDSALIYLHAKWFQWFYSGYMYIHVEHVAATQILSFTHIH